MPDAMPGSVALQYVYSTDIDATITPAPATPITPTPDTIDPNSRASPTQHRPHPFENFSTQSDTRHMNFTSLPILVYWKRNARKWKV